MENPDFGGWLREESGGGLAGSREVKEGIRMERESGTDGEVGKK